MAEFCQGKISPCCLQLKLHTAIPFKAFLLKVLPPTLFAYTYFSRVQLSRNFLRTLLDQILKFMHRIIFKTEYYVLAPPLKSAHVTSQEFFHSKVYTGIIQSFHESCTGWRLYPWHRGNTSKEGKNLNNLHNIGALHATQENSSRTPSGLLIRSSLASIDFVRLRQPLNMITVTNFGFAGFLKVLKELNSSLYSCRKPNLTPVYCQAESIFEAEQLRGGHITASLGHFLPFFHWVCQQVCQIGWTVKVLFIYLVPWGSMMLSFHATGQSTACLFLCHQWLHEKYKNQPKTKHKNPSWSIQCSPKKIREFTECQYNQLPVPSGNSWRGLFNLL